MKFRLIYDDDLQKNVEEFILPFVQHISTQSEPYTSLTSINKLNDESILTYLSDEQLKDLLPQLADIEVRVAVLPHPQAQHMCKALGVDYDLTTAIEFYKTSTQPIKVDILYCNNKPVFDHLIIGQTITFTSKKLYPSAVPLKRRKKSIISFWDIKPFRVELDLEKGKKVKTAATDLAIFVNREGTFLSRLLPDDYSINDGKLHMFIISPQSLAEMMYFAIATLWEKNKIPSFGAHIRTKQLTLTFPDREREYIIDGQKYSGKTIELTVAKKQIEFIAGAHLPEIPTTAKNGEIYKLKGLPTGEAALELANRSLPLIRHATTDEFKDLFQVLRDNARIKSSYLVLMVLSTILAAFGLFADSTPVVIGAMILAPLMQPIISLSMGTLRQDKKLISKSIITILVGMGLSMFFAVLITWLTPLVSASSEIAARIRPNLLDLGIAVVSGIAGAYAHAREEVAKTLAGVAIAVALIPPLAVTAIGLGWGNLEIFAGAALLLITNLAGIVLAAAATFLVLGFSPFKLAGKGLMISLIIVLGLCIPLAYSFRLMVNKNRIQRQVESLSTDYAIIRNVQVQNTSPIRLSIMVVSKSTISDEGIDELKRLIEEKLNNKVEIEVVTATQR